MARDGKKKDKNNKKKKNKGKKKNKDQPMMAGGRKKEHTAKAKGTIRLAVMEQQTNATLQCMVDKKQSGWEHAQTVLNKRRQIANRHKQSVLPASP